MVNMKLKTTLFLISVLLLSLAVAQKEKINKVVKEAPVDNEEEEEVDDADTEAVPPTPKSKLPDRTSDRSNNSPDPERTEKKPVPFLQSLKTFVRNNIITARKWTDQSMDLFG